MGNISVKMPDGNTVPLSFPDDWSQDQIKDAIYKHFPNFKQYASEIAPTPFNAQQPMHPEQLNQQPDENTGVMGIFRDALSGLGHAFQSGAEYVRGLPEEVPAAFSQIRHNPLRAIENIGAGGIDIAKGIINAPRDLGYYLKRKQLPTLPDSALNMLPQYPEDTGVEKYLGLDKPEKGDAFLRSTPALATGGAAVKSLSKAFRAPDVTKKIKSLQSNVNKRTDDIGQTLNQIESAVEKKGISNVDIDFGLIDAAKDYLPKTKANKILIEKAQDGNYKALRKLQADLRVKGEKALSSELVAENDLGAEILDLRHDINSSIFDHLKNTGNDELAAKLSKSINDYKKIKDTYFSSPGLARVFGESQKVPKNLLNFLAEDSAEMNAFKAEHPELSRMLTKALKRKRDVKRLGKAASIAGYGTSTALAEKLLGK